MPRSGLRPREEISLLDLYEFGGKIEWLLWAVQLQVTQASQLYFCIR